MRHGLNFYGKSNALWVRCLASVAVFKITSKLKHLIFDLQMTLDIENGASLLMLISNV